MDLDQIDGRATAERRTFIGRFLHRIAPSWQTAGDNEGGFIPTVLMAWAVELLYGLVCGGWPGGLRIFCILWFASGAAFFIGTIGGFLFGIPKARLRATEAERPIPVVTEMRTGAYVDNTNLEEVSDWLTKIIIGLGLVEFRYIVSAVAAAGVVVGAAIDPGKQFGGTAIATGSLIVGFATGFIYYYLWTRVYLGKRLAEKGR